MCSDCYVDAKNQFQLFSCSYHVRRKDKIHAVVLTMNLEEKYKLLRYVVSETLLALLKPIYFCTAFYFKIRKSKSMLIAWVDSTN